MAEQKQKEISSPVQPARKSKNTGLRFVALFSIIVVIFIISNFLSFIFPMASPRILLGMIFSRFGEKSMDQLADQSLLERKTVVSASSSEGVAELDISASGDNMTLTAQDKSQWPEDAIGGVYQLEPSVDKFSKPTIFRVKLNKDPGPNFSLGYWHTDTKQWEWLPTVKKDENTYETVLVHASSIGGAQRSDYKPKFTDPANQALANEAGKELQKLQGEQQTGNETDASWEKIWEIMDQLVNRAIQNYCSNQSVESTKDFYATWELTQYLGFPSLSMKMGDTVDNKCKEKKINVEYRIKQTDDYNINANLNIGHGSYKLNATSLTRVISTGSPQNPSVDAGSLSWKTNWRVYMDYRTEGTANQRAYLESKSLDSHMLLDISGHDIKGVGTSTSMLTFSLSGVSEGQTFPMESRSVVGYVARAYGPPMKNVLIVEDSDGMNFHWNKNTSVNTTDELAAGKTFHFTGVLIKDNGVRGAVIGFTKMPIMNSDQLNQFKSTMQEAPAELQNLFDAQGNPTFLSGDMDSKPLRIMPVSELPEDPKPEDDYKSNDQELQKQREDEKKYRQQHPEEYSPADQNGDGIPDIVPLPSN